PEGALWLEPPGADDTRAARLILRICCILKRSVGMSAKTVQKPRETAPAAAKPEAHPVQAPVPPPAPPPAPQAPPPEAPAVRVPRVGEWVYYWAHDPGAMRNPAAQSPLPAQVIMVGHKGFPFLHLNVHHLGLLDVQWDCPQWDGRDVRHRMG